MYTQIRNIAIIAHVDHGKTTITDAIMRQTGVFGEGESMDIDALERERGITIYAKNTAVIYKDTKINIVDTPGHADFGSEVERILRSIDSVLLVVDAQEGPMPQTRFVLQKALNMGHRPIVAINKIDKPAADPQEAFDAVFELFMELEATEEQLDFPVLYTIGREGIAKRRVDEPGKNIFPLLDSILEHVPPAPNNHTGAARAQVFNLSYNDFLGRLAVVRVYDGTLHEGGSIFIKHPDRKTREGKITKIQTFRGIRPFDTPSVQAGDIALIAGIPDISIGDTVTTERAIDALPSIAVEDPTVTVTMHVNDSPFAGKEGEYVTGRQLRERLEKELEMNVGLQVDYIDGTTFQVSGRGELHLAILLENMRREGYEMQVSQPRTITKQINGVLHEPYAEVLIDVPAQYQSTVIKSLGRRKGLLINAQTRGERVRLTLHVPVRGMLGYRTVFVVETKGEGILADRFLDYRPHARDIMIRTHGSMTSMTTGTALSYALYNLQQRGELYITPGTPVYEGMVIGSTARGDELTVNPTKGKQLTNMRASGSDDTIVLTPPTLVTIENGLERMGDDEFLEITPKSVRLRKQILNEAMRAKVKRGSN